MMKFTSLFLLLFAVQLSASVYSQQTRLKVDFNRATIKEVMTDIENQTGMTFFYSDDVLNVDKMVNLTSKSMALEDVLILIGEQTGLSFTIVRDQILVKKAGATDESFIQQQVSLSGKVSDVSGSPLPGVTVVVKGTTRGTVTDSNGNYSLSNVDSDARLVFSFIGMRTQEIPVSGKTIINVILAEETVGLGEVVAIGYGTMRRSLVTNAISTVKLNENDMRSALSPSQLLDGRVAGVTVSTGSGNLGSSERVSIRGISSLSAGNEPLYVIDGIPITNTNSSIFNFGENMSSLSVLNLNDIESIDILKDAASAAIYGSRATNGVVVITTKSGKEGKSEFRVNLNTGFSQFPNKNKLHFSDSKLWLEVYNEGIDNYNKEYGLKVGDDNYKSHLFNPFGDLPDTDWLSVITQTGASYNLDASFSGGTQKTKFYIGGTYNSQDGIIKTNSINKINLRAKISHQMSSWLEIGANNSGNFIKNNQVPGANLGSTIIGRAVEQRPFDRPYKPNGDYFVGGTDELRRHNPLQILNEENAYIDNFRYLGNFYALFKYKDKLTLRTSFNSDINYIYDNVYYNANHPYGTGVGRIVEYNRFINNTLVDNVLNYKDKFGNLDAEGMLGHSFQKIFTRTSMIDGRGFPSPAFDVISAASEIYDATGNFSEFAMESYFGRATLSYSGKYILNTTLRTDGSSKFAPDTRWGWFPSISLGWNISKEDFLTGKDIDLKFRISYGKTGNQNGIGNYDYQPMMSGGKNYGNESGIAVTSFGNNSLTWETADQYDLGFDMSLLKGKINLLFDAYQKNTNNLLYDKPVPATTGVTTITSNIGTMRNRGIEFSVNTHLNLGNVGWSSYFNISTNKNKLMSLLGGDSDSNSPIAIGSNRVLQVGKEVGAFYLFKMDGIYQYDGEVSQQQYDLGVRAGDVKWRDLDGNGIINDNDRVVTGTSNPDFFGGWSNTFKYKNFQLDFSTTYMYGNDVYAEWKATGTGRIGYLNANLEDIVTKRWTGPGTTNKYPRSISGDTNNDKNSDRWLEDGSFIRLSSLTLSYNFTATQLKKLKIKSLRLYAQGENLFILTKYSGWDPEVSKNMDPRYFGVDLFSVPQPRTISFGANISF